jgi:hypothetical protein
MQDAGVRDSNGTLIPLRTVFASQTKIKDKLVARLQDARKREAWFPNPAPRIPHPASSPAHSCNNQVKSSSQRLTALRTSSGDHTGKETPVPIPNTAVKLSGPMIVPTSAKVGIARFYF